MTSQTLNLSSLSPEFSRGPNRYGDWVRSGWRNVLEVVLRLHRLGLLPPRVLAADGEDDATAKARMPRPPAAKKGSQGNMITRAFNK